MLSRVLLYELACGDTEATLFDINDDEIVVVDCDPKGAALIAWLREQAVEVTEWESDQLDILSVELLTF